MKRSTNISGMTGSHHFKPWYYAAEVFAQYLICTLVLLPFIYAWSTPERFGSWLQRMSCTTTPEYSRETTWNWVDHGWPVDRCQPGFTVARLCWWVLRCFGREGTHVTESEMNSWAMKMAAARWFWLGNLIHHNITSLLSSHVSSLKNIRNMPRQKSESRTARVLVLPLTVVKHIVMEKGQAHPKNAKSLSRTSYTLSHWHMISYDITQCCSDHAVGLTLTSEVMTIPWDSMRAGRVACCFFCNDGYLHVFVPGVVHESHTWFVLLVLQILFQHVFFLQAGDWPIGLPCAKAMALWREKLSHDGEASSDKIIFLGFETAEQHLKVSQWADSCVMQVWATMVCWTSLGH